MADNVAITPGAGVAIASDDIGGVQYPRVKVSRGADGEGRDWQGQCTPHRALSAASNNTTVVKASAGWLHYIIVSNTNATVRFLKLYDKSTTPAPASDAALLKLVIPIPPSNLTPMVIPFPEPVKFANGIGYALVTGISDTDNTSVSANEHLINIGYE